jgi:murein DD-endopeptidase MepM/ murein hydrolase activator NlpD
MRGKLRVVAPVAACLGLAGLAGVAAAFMKSPLKTPEALPAPALPAQTTPLPPLTISRVVTLENGQTLAAALKHAGFPGSQAQAILNALAEHHVALNKVRAGQKIALSYTEAAPYQVGDAKVDFRVSAEDTAHLKVENGAVSVAGVEHHPLVAAHSVAVGHIAGSLWEDATEAGLPSNLVKPFVDMFSWDVDFTREIQPGDTFKVMFESWRDQDGKVQKTGRILAAELWAKGQRHSTYWYNGDYYDDKGETKKKLLLRTPLEVFRISSVFGFRHHPVLGYSRMHKGTDFAAPYGTPIKASGDGTIAFEGRHGGHGNYILIHHNATYDTGYAHISRFAKGLHVGSHVKQGQIIAYVGSTGLSTGPHLHYEVHVHGQAVDPMNTKLPTSVMLAGAAKAKFKAMVGEVQTAWNRAFNAVQVASR